jgi:hypothetical protein
LTSELDSKYTEIIELKDRFNLFNSQKQNFKTELDQKLKEQEKVFGEKIEIIQNENVLLSKKMYFFTSELFFLN